MICWGYMAGALTVNPRGFTRVYYCYLLYYSNLVSIINVLYCINWLPPS